MKRNLLVLITLVVVLGGVPPVETVAAWNPWASEKESWVLRDMKLLTYSYPSYQGRRTSGWVTEDGITRWVATYNRGLEDKVSFGSYAVRESEIIKKEGERTRSGDGQLTGDLIWEDILHYTFQPPPDMLVPGKKVQLRLEGTFGGKPYDGVRYWSDKRRFMMRVEKWTLDDQREWTVSFETLDLSYENRSASSVLEFRVPETSEGRLVIYGYTDVEHIKDVMWVYEPGFAEDVDRPRILDPGEGLEDVPGIISVLGPGVEIRAKDGSGWKPAMDRTALMQGDRIRTASGGKAHVTYKDPSGGVANLTIGSDTEIDFDEFRGPAAEEWGVVSLLQGMIRWTVKSWRANSIFDVRAGTTITGVRGCDVMINYPPGSDSVEILVHEGNVTMRDDASGLHISVPEGQRITVRDGRVGDSGLMDVDAWARFTTNSGMDIDEALFTQAAPPASTHSSPTKPSTPSGPSAGESSPASVIELVIVIAVAAAMAAAVAFIGVRMLKKSRR